MITVLGSAHVTEMAILHAESFDKGWSEAEMQGHIENDIATGWVENDALAGFILMRAAADQAEVLTIAVAEAAQNKGLGGRLLSAAEEACIKKGVKVIFLEVAEDNPAAIALYCKAGYEGFGRRPGYYKRAGGRVAARLFQKKL